MFVPCCFLAFPFWARLDFGLRNGPHSTFDSPMRDIAIASAQFVHQHDNVRRPGESHRGAGRKKNLIYPPSFSSLPPPPFPLVHFCFTCHLVDHSLSDWSSPSIRRIYLKTRQVRRCSAKSLGLASTYRSEQIAAEESTGS